MKTIGILKEIHAGECRVAATPETVGKMMQAKLAIHVENGAGLNAHIQDNDYTAAGAQIETQAETVYKQADIILKVQKPSFDANKNHHEVDLLRENSILIAPLFPLQNPKLIQQLAAKKITAFSLDLLPRIARAQSMDILSSMSSLAGYKSVILAAQYLSKLFPMMTTAAGTIIPAKVIVIGAGVAGLQAIATARRLGAVVLAFDTRPIVAEQVKSLGAEFVSLETSHEASQDTGGYAKEQSAEFYQHEQEIIQQYLKEADVIITTALIPGKRAPLLITAKMVNAMKPGAVIVDLAAEQQGNCELTQAGKITTVHAVTIIGLLNLPSTMPIHASQLYAKNLWAFLQYILKLATTEGFDLSDEIISACLITHQGEILHQQVKQLLQEPSAIH